MFSVSATGTWHLTRQGGCTKLISQRSCIIYTLLQSKQDLCGYRADLEDPHPGHTLNYNTRIASARTRMLSVTRIKEREIQDLIYL